MYELSKDFHFEAAHTLERIIGTEGSRRIHGHSYRGEIVLRGEPDPKTGMIADLGILERELAAMHDALDHRFLDDIPDLVPATMERLAYWIWQRMFLVFPNLYRVNVYRDSNGEKATYQLRLIS